MDEATLTLSVVVPMYNEEDVLPRLVERLRPALDGIGVAYEVVAVDDGSSDSTASLVERLRADWHELRLVRLMRNSGHQAALGAGLLRSLGQYVVSIDADLQDPPEAIGPMLERARSESLDVVYGVRSDRSADSIGKRTTARVYYRLMRRLAGPQVPHDAGDFRLVSRRVVHALAELPEHGRVYRLIIPWLGFPSAEHPFVRERRAAGESKYPLTAMIRLAFDSVTAFSAAPLRAATWAGAIGALACVVLVTWSIAVWLVGDTFPGWASTVILVTGLGALQLLCLGLLGEYVGRLYNAAQGRPSFLIGYDSERDLAAPEAASERPRAATSTPGITNP